MTIVKKAANSAETTLAQNITSTATSFSVTDGSAFPTESFLASINDEIMFVGSRSGNSFSNVVRGIEGTVKAAHDAGDTVANRFTAGAHMQLIDGIDTVASDLDTHKADKATPDEAGHIMVGENLSIDQDGKLNAKSGYPQSKFDAIGLPTKNDDETEGYGVGSMWFVNEIYRAYVCLDASEGNAVWEPYAKSGALRYGIRIAKGDANPESRIEYILDAQGAVPARMNYVTGKFDYGDWHDIWFVEKNYPCMLNYDGTEAYLLNPNDYSKNLVGGNSDVANTAFPGNAMAAFPLVWIKQYEDDDYQYIILCEQQYDATYEAFAHQRADGSLMDRIYLAMFKGADDGTRLRSISGLQPMHTQTATTEISRAQANGALWTTRTWAHWNMVSSLLSVISKHDNSQLAFGNGNLSGANQVMQTGTLNTAGQFMGYNDNTHQVKVFHMEGWWADQWARIQGLLNVNGDIKVKMTPPYNLTGAGFISTGLTPSGTSGEYIKTSRMLPLGRIPMATGATSETYQCDGLWLDNGVVAVARVGGECGVGARCGLSCVGLDGAASSAGWYSGAALSCEQPLIA